MTTYYSRRLQQRQDDMQQVPIHYIPSCNSSETRQQIRAVKFDHRRRVVDDIEEMLEAFGAFTTEVYLVDGNSHPMHEDVDAEVEIDSAKLRRMAEQIADYILG